MTWQQRLADLLAAEQPPPVTEEPAWVTRARPYLGHHLWWVQAWAEAEISAWDRAVALQAKRRESGEA